MIHPERIIVATVMVGVAVGGFVWFAWGTAENLMAALRRAARKRKREAKNEKHADIEDEVKSEQGK